MALLNQHELAEEENKGMLRERSIEQSVIADTPNIPGILCIRGISPLVMLALQRSNNPYITGKTGFEDAGIKFTDKGTVKNFAAFGVSMMPKTAAILVLWTCDIKSLKHFALNPDALEDAALDYMESFPGGIAALANVTIHISEALQALQLARAVPVDDGKPQASTLGEGGDIGPKKPARTGSHKS